MKFLVFLCLFSLLSFADVKIVSTKQIQNGVLLNFNQNIAEENFKSFVLGGDKEFRYVYDVNAELLGSAKNFKFQENIQIKIAQNSKDKVRIVISSNKKLKITLEASKKQASFAILNAKSVKNTPSIASLFETPKRTTNLQNTQTSIKRKVVVIDPGHGGKDCGAVGVSKVCEKKIVLNIGKHLRDELKRRGYLVYMTRDKDKFISLRDRTKFANQKEADLFVSIHANAVAENKEKLQGIESYFLSTARSERAKKVAALENKDDTEVMTYFSRQSFLNTLNTQKIIASNRLAIDVQYGMLQNLKPKYKITDGGVREGPFWVLVGALMPSILLEVGYLTHPNEGKRLNQNTFQKDIAQGIADGIDGYFAKNP
ncbi:N-acetylmuramoyl-L-alanine amidase [Helicobacter valdiviensis]|uniref:N-acetylmuramoyl-L-alanine amidase n=1 Tax=Helicobacter valdiviensis TaxID=1458358 RepID=A0A2W6MWI6_9HELI|nr:N-acetylmuramoyl-L-alanine amidase [Helicobacter valdiviensis]PZT48702.1 N-acetylmuramoyl-L-alanine amidase [Helicobacter valdiviensis]